QDRGRTHTSLTSASSGASTTCRTVRATLLGSRRTSAGCTGYSLVSCAIGVCVGPGATVETRTPSSVTCWRRPSARACSACFEAEYTVWNGTELHEAPDPT